MKCRFTFALLTVIALTGTACAAGGGGGASSGPEPVEGMPEGTRPSENSFTQTAQLLLLQAQGAANPEEGRPRFQEALAQAMGSIETEPGNPLGYRIAAEAQVGLGDFAAADSMLLKAEEIYPAYSLESPAVREGAWVNAYNDAIGLVQAGDMQVALQAFRDADLIYAARPEALIQIGSIEAQLGNNVASAEAYQKALDMIQGPLFAEQDAETQADWKGWEEICAINVAQAYGRESDHARAAAAYEAYLESNPDNINAKSQLANALIQLERADSAMAIYDNLIADPSLGARDIFIVGIGLYQAEEFGKASEAFGRAAELTPKSRDAAYNYAQTLFLSSTYEPLTAAAEHLLELDPNNTNAYRLRAQGLLNNGFEDAAMEVMGELEELQFEVIEPVLQPIAGGGATITGAVANLLLDVGTQLTVRFHYTTEDNMEAGTSDVVYTATEPDIEVEFQTELDSTMAILGYWYEIIM